jgi:hypothetical protein
MFAWQLAHHRSKSVRLSLSRSLLLKLVLPSVGEMNCIQEQFIFMNEDLPPSQTHEQVEDRAPSLTVFPSWKRRDVIDKVNFLPKCPDLLSNLFPAPDVGGRKIPHFPFTPPKSEPEQHRKRKAWNLLASRITEFMTCIMFVGLFCLVCGIVISICTDAYSLVSKPIRIYQKGRLYRHGCELLCGKVGECQDQCAGCPIFMEGWCTKGTSTCATKDEILGAQYMKQSADFGNAQAQNAIGLLLEYGNVVEKNETQAVEYYKQAAAQGHLNGQLNYARVLVNGVGIARDPVQGATIFRQLAEQGDANALYQFGVCLEHGLGVNKDVDLARHLYKQAMEKGHVEAKKAYEREQGFVSGLLKGLWKIVDATQIHFQNKING